MKVGIPRALMFYRYYPFLRAFVEGCGHRVVPSPPTDLAILERGTELCVDDICVAVKAYFGHVDYLKDKVDVLLVPRLVSVERRKHDTFTCPKLIAAPDMVRFSPHRPPMLLEWVLDVKRAPWWWGCAVLARRLGATPCRALEAYRAAWREQGRYERMLREGMLPEEALEGMEGTEGMGAREEDAREGKRARMTPSRLHDAGEGGARRAAPRRDLRDEVTVAVVGHPYLLGDRLLNKDLVHWLRGSGARVVAGTVFSDEELAREAASLPDLSWSYERELLAAASLFTAREEVDGIVYLTSFGCGPDSMAMEMFKREMLPRGGKAFMEVVLDEHSAASGVRTRAEAFVDMLRYRKAGEWRGNAMRVVGGMGGAGVRAGET